jgi:DNA-binding IclR family transcriptional regulator
MSDGTVGVDGPVPGAQSLERALAILNAVAEQPGRPPQLAARLEIPRPTVIRILRVLERHRYVARGNGAYVLGTRALELSARWNEQVGVVRLVSPALDELVAHFQETAFVCIRDGTESLCIAGRESSRAVRFGLSIGARTALYAGAFSKVLLAYAPPHVVDEVIAHGLERLTARTITDPAQLRANLRKIRRERFAETNGEADDGVTGLAAAIPTADGEAIAIGVALPTLRAHADVKKEIRATLVDMARGLARNPIYTVSSTPLAPSAAARRNRAGS